MTITWYSPKSSIRADNYDERSHQHTECTNHIAAINNSIKKRWPWGKTAVALLSP
jgi:hypothetical protein